MSNKWKATQFQCPKVTSFEESIPTVVEYEENYSDENNPMTYESHGFIPPSLIVTRFLSPLLFIQEIPYFKFRFKFNGYWKKLNSMEVPANTTCENPFVEVKTEEFKISESATISTEFGISVSAESDVPFAKVSATIESKFGESWTHSTEFGKSNSIQVTAPSFKSIKEVRAAVWQRFGSYQVVYLDSRNPETGWLPMGNAVNITNAHYAYDYFPADGYTSL
jgi:hypothetical protein